MAHGVMGALNAEGFCVRATPAHTPCLCSRLSVQPVALCPPQERMLRVAGHVLTEGNTLLSDDELEKLTILRKNYSHLSRQQFNRTVVEP